MQGLIDQVLKITAIFVTPDWGGLIGLLPVVILGVFLLWLALTIRRFASIGPARRAPARLTPIAPPDVHMPGPSLAPFLAAFGAAALVWGLVVGGTGLLIGFGILVLTLLWWGREAIRDYDRVAPREALPAVVHAGPPEGVHVPGPSIRPLMAAAGATALVAGLVLGGALLVVGAAFLFWTLAGWLTDARAEYAKTVEADATGHLENIPARSFPRGAVVAFAVVALVVAGFQSGLLPPSFESGAGPAASAAPSGGPVLPPGTLSVVAKDVAFDVRALEVPAGKEFSIQLRNEDPGIPHNIEIRGADGSVIQTQPNVPGGQSVVYTYQPLQAGTYTFICLVHPIPSMTGTLTVK